MGKLDIDGNHSFIDQFLEYQTNLNLVALFHKVVCLALGPILFCFNQLPFLKRAP